jgi:GNAT superfamily N-acetyltransferase
VGLYARSHALYAACVKPADVKIRPARADDAPAVLDLLAQGFETYRRFAPEGWEPPVPQSGSGIALGELLVDPRVWYGVAEDERGHAAQCGFAPAHERRNMQGAPLPGMAHLWQLFVREDRWGSGLADELHARALAEMRARGYERGRLGTPVGQARSRAFYEKRGWRTAPHSMKEPPDLAGLALVEYRIEL